MANTFTQMYIHIVFSVKFRAAMIDKSWKEQLLKYITGIVQNHQHKMICINSMPDHLHMLIGMKPHQSLSDLIRMVKADSSKWINERRLTRQRFNWQEGFGGFSVSGQQLNIVINYILQQEAHHSKKKFRTEYKELLVINDIEFEEKYIFIDPS